MPPSLTLLPEQMQSRWGFLLALGNTTASAEDNYDQGLDLMASGNLRDSHQQAWAELWLESTVELVGSETLSKAVIGCLFYLLSAFPPLHDIAGFGGVSPGGLSNGREGQDYWGHVFWDQVKHHRSPPPPHIYFYSVLHYCSSSLINTCVCVWIICVLQDIWMYPAIALFYPRLARAVLEYRVRTIDGAKDNAQKQGFKVRLP